MKNGIYFIAFDRKQTQFCVEFFVFCDQFGCAANFLQYIPVRTLVWVCSKLSTVRSCKDTKMASPQLIFQRHQCKESREFVGDSRERSPVNWWAYLPLTCMFHQNQNNNLSQTNPRLSTRYSPQILRIDREGIVDEVKMYEVIL